MAKVLFQLEVNIWQHRARMLPADASRRRVPGHMCGYPCISWLHELGHIGYGIRQSKLAISIAEDKGYPDLCHISRDANRKAISLWAL